MSISTIVKVTNAITNAVLKNGWSRAEVKLFKEDGALYVTAAGTSAPKPGCGSIVTRNTDTMHVIFMPVKGYVQVTEVAGRCRWFLSAEVESLLADLARGLEHINFRKDTTLPEFYPQVEKESLYW